VIRRRWVSAAALSLLLAAQPLTAEATGEPPLEPGAEGFVRTVLTADRIEEIPLTYIGRLTDAIGPGYDLHLVQLQGPLAEKVGVAAGMSGSPVYFDGRLIGALSYRLGTLPRDPVAGVTPIEDMLDASRAEGHQLPADSSAAPIGTPVSAGGLAEPVREWLEPRLGEMGFVLSLGGAAASDDREPASLEPGSPVAVALVRGDLTMAATGTVTYIDGDRVYAFGHPFFGTGRVEMPMHSATVIHTLTDMLGSSKLAEVGPEIGAIVDDRLPAIVGRTGVQARMIPLVLRITGADYEAREFNFEVVKNSNLTPLLAGTVVANALVGNSGYDSELTVVSRGTIELDGFPDLPIEMAYAGGRGSNPAVAVGARLFQLLGGLWINPFDPVDVRRIVVEVEAAPEIRRYRVDSVIRDRQVFRPGQRLSLRTVLRRYRGEQESRELELMIPDYLVGQGVLALAVGPPSYIERALGAPLTRRLQTADRLPAVVQVFAELRSEHRLVAVLYHRSQATVANGVAYDALPPTARRLLGLGKPSGAPARSPATVLARVDVEFDGPVEGGMAMELRYDADLTMEGKP